MGKAKTSNPLGTVDPRFAVAIANLSCPKHQRDQLTIGKYPVDVVIHLKGNLSVGEDYESTQPNKVDPWTLIQILLDKCPSVTIADVVAEAEAIVAKKDAVGPGSDKARAEEVLDLIKTKAQDAVDAIKQATKIMKKGPVSFDDAEIEIMSEAKRVARGA